MDDLARTFGGGQCIRLALSQTEIPLELKRALIYLPFKKPMEVQLRECERIYLTSDGQWDPDALHDGIRDNQMVLDGLERIDLNRNDIAEDQGDEGTGCVGTRTRSHTTANVNNVGTEERVLFVEEVCDIPNESALYFGAEVHGSKRTQPAGTGALHGRYPGNIGSEIDCTTEHGQCSASTGTGQGDQSEVGLGQSECHGTHPEGHDAAIEELLETTVKKTFQVAGTHPKSQQVGGRVLHGYVFLGNQVN